MPSIMPKAVQLSAYGGLDQLNIVELPTPQAGAGELLVRTMAAGTNPGEISIREGFLKDMFPMDFPFGQGADFAGIVETIGAGVSEFETGDEVMGWTDQRRAQAEFIVVPASQVIAKPPALDWYRAGSLFVVASTASSAVRAVSLKPGDVVAISGAAGGVGSLTVQLAVRSGARAIGIASTESKSFLRSVGAEHVAYGDDLPQRLRAAAPQGIDAFIDLYGKGYVDLAVELGIDPQRIETIIDFAAASKYGVKAEGSAASGDRETLKSVAELIAWGEIVAPIAALYPLDRVRDAYAELALRKSHGKIVFDLSGRVTKPLHPPF
jgi:NADPH:quinone reductase-like Zn-dependent oxidoreductase